MDRNALMAGYGIAEGVAPQYAQNYNDYARNALMRRATVLPLAEYADGSVRPAVPSMIQDGIDAFFRIPQMAQDNEWRAAGYMGGVAGGAAMTGALAAPRPANSIGMGGKPTQQPGIRAYHGSPHDFDKFDMSKIGTGEGTQAYGPGLYFAEAEDVAKGYRDSLTHPIIDGKPIDYDNPKHWMSIALDDANGDKTGAYKTLEKWYRESSIADQISIQKAMQAIGADEVPDVLPKVTDKGRMYEVRINASPDDFLDWDKPLAQQSEKVRGIIANAGLEPWQIVDPSGMRRGPISKAEAEQTTRGLAEPFSGARGKDVAELAGAGRAEFGQKQNVNVLRDAGIVGTKYLDQGSRTVGEGTRNYVMFRDDIIDVVKKYGVVAAASLYGMDAVQSVMGGDTEQNPLMRGY